MKILLVHPRPTRGGFSAVVSQAHEIARIAGVTIGVAVMDGPRLVELPAGVEVFVLPALVHRPAGARALRRIIKSFGPDVLHVHGRQAGLVGRVVAPRRQHRTVLYTPHGTPWVGTSWVKSFLNDVLERALLPRTTRVLCVGYSEVVEWAKRDGGTKSVYFPNPLPESTLSFTATPQPDGVSNGSRPTVLVPSGFNRQKRLEVLLEALELIPSPRPLVRFRGAVDDPDYLAELQTQAARTGLSDDVWFDHEEAGILELLASADLTVLPSFSEGLPIIGQEAIAAQARVAWSRIGPHFELFGSEGAPFWTAEDLARVLQADFSEASVSTRRDWLIAQQEDGRQRRKAFWSSVFASDSTREVAQS